MDVLLRETTELPDVGSLDQSIDFHRRLPGYHESPLLEAPRLAKILGVAKVYIKDETSRFGLPSFKILGASWATYTALSEQLGPIVDDSISLKSLQTWVSPARPLTLIAATDGNHGRAVARVAQWLGLSARIFVPDFVSPSRCRAIEAEGAELVVIDGVYDASVDAALEAAQNTNTLLISDTARSVSDSVPRLVTAGYTTIFTEVNQQLSRFEEAHIDAVSIQAGVGGLASACTSWAKIGRGDKKPSHVIVVEPKTANCVMTALAAGEPLGVSANQVSKMSVLQCGTVSCTAFANLQAGVSCCLAIEDSWAVTAASELRACGVRTGLSGAAGVAGLLAVFRSPFVGSVQEHLGLFSDARLLVVATEMADGFNDPTTTR